MQPLGLDDTGPQYFGFLGFGDYSTAKAPSAA
jgi:hypothetical protein